MSLQDWLKSGWLAEHQTSPQEVAELLGIVDRDLVECQTPGLSPDWRLNIAYNAALQASIAALAASGYRAARESQHHHAIQSLAYTIGADHTLVSALDRFRKKRNVTGYLRAGAVSEQEAKEMFGLAKGLRDSVERWLRTNHPHLLKADRRLR